MTKYASYDSTTTRVNGWYDTDLIDNANLDLTQLVVVSDDIWAERLDQSLCVVNGVVQVYVPPVPTQAELIAAAKSSLAAIRYTHEIAGVYFTASGQSSGSLVATDRDSQSKLIAVFVLSNAGMWTDGTEFKMADASFVPLTGADAKAMAMTAQGYVAACFARESALSAQISATTDTASLAAVDLTAGWPSQGAA